MNIPCGYGGAKNEAFLSLRNHQVPRQLHKPPPPFVTAYSDESNKVKNFCVAVTTCCVDSKRWPPRNIFSDGTTNNHRTRVAHDSDSILFEVVRNQRSHVGLHIGLMQQPIIADVWTFSRDVCTKVSQDLVVILFINSHLRRTHVLIYHHASVIEEGNQLRFPSQFLLTHFAKFLLILTLPIFTFAFGEGTMVMNLTFAFERRSW